MVDGKLLNLYYYQSCVFSSLRMRVGIVLSFRKVLSWSFRFSKQRYCQEWEPRDFSLLKFTFVKKWKTTGKRDSSEWEHYYSNGSPWHRKVHCFFPSDLVPGLEPFSWFSYLLTTRRRHRRVNQCLCHDTQRKCWIHQNPFQSRHWIWQHKEKSKYATKVSLWTSNSERDESDNGRRYARESDVSVNRQAWMVWEITVFSSWESNFTSTAAKSRTDNEEEETMNPLTWLLSTPTLAPMEKVFYLINFESDKLGVFVFSIDQKKTPVVLCRVLTFLVRGCVWLFRMWVLD